jgi:hypothetical protein
VSDAIASSGAVSVTFDDLLLRLKLGGDVSVETLLTHRLAVARAVAEGLTVTDEEISAETADLYAQLDLFEEVQVAAWLARMHLTAARVEQDVRDRLLIAALRLHLVPDELVEQRFHASFHDYGTAAMEVLAFASQGAAAELAIQMREGETTWGDAALRARDVTSQTLQRRQVPEEVASSLFAAPPGTIVGPAENEEGQYALYRILFRRDPILDDELRETIRQELFHEALRQELAKGPVTYLR